ncbi:MAG: chorismate mutase [Candidatus Methanomethylophilaceae archaeon]|nr:chorismate mutase [Candidatus Methanomethylophilaceae archaeon]
MDNDELRKRIASIDEKIILLVADRMQTAYEIGRNKKTAGLPVYDPEVERTVIARYRRIATEEHLDPDSAEELAKILMAWSRRIQE